MLDNEKYRPIFERARFANFNNEEMKEFNADYKRKVTRLMENEYSRKEGRIEGKIELAEKLLKKNILNAKQIADLSGLPLSQIKAIEAPKVHA